MLRAKRMSVESHFNSSRLVPNSLPDTFLTDSVIPPVQIQVFRLPQAG